MIRANIAELIQAVDSLDRLITNGKFRTYDSDTGKIIEPTAIKSVELDGDGDPAEMEITFEPCGYARVYYMDSMKSQHWVFHAR